MDNVINQIMNFCTEKTQELIAELEQERFSNQGQFNGHEKWADNQVYKHPNAQKSVREDKGRNEPLVDSGALKRELTTANNWDLLPSFANGTLKLTMPSREGFTDTKYDKLDVGVDHYVEYISPRGNKVAMEYIPARHFKDLSDQDANWVVNKLAQAIKDKFQ